MTRIFSVILCLLMAVTLFSGCVKDTEVICLTEFESTVNISKDDLKITGNLVFKSPDEMTLTVTEPEEIENTVVSCSNGEISFSCGDLNFSINSISFGNDVFSPLFESLKLIGEAGLEVNKNGVNKISLPENGINLVFSSDDMRIASLEKYGVIYQFDYA